jgi:MOSC domain-containing protein YiiM
MTRGLSEILQELAALPAPPKKEGWVEGLVLRPERGERKVVETLVLTVDGGIAGDRWGLKARSNKDRQVSAIRADVLACLASDQAMALSGDNLHLCLDLSEDNLPVGAELQVGAVHFRVSPEHHAPCGLFAGRFGPRSHDAVLSEKWLRLRGRGVLLEVLEGGTIRLGDKARVIHT